MRCPDPSRGRLAGPGDLGEAEPHLRARGERDERQLFGERLGSRYHGPGPPVRDAVARRKVADLAFNDAYHRLLRVRPAVVQALVQRDERRPIPRQVVQEMLAGPCARLPEMGSGV